MPASPLHLLIRSIVAGDAEQVGRRLRATPALATMASPVGATRQEATNFFFPAVSRYLYAGDTALHMAAAACSRSMAELLVSLGANCRVRNRRGAEPLHYASDAHPREPQAQAELIAYFISIGADPGAADNSGVAPLHRAVRARSLGGVRALLDGGANPLKPNRSGSTPLHLAVQNTGKSGSGSDVARHDQAAIIKLLLERGAKPGDSDGRGRRVAEAATGEWIRVLLKTA